LDIPWLLFGREKSVGGFTKTQPRWSCKQLLFVLSALSSDMFDWYTMSEHVAIDAVYFQMRDGRFW
jgi:hypothetical protein